MVLDLQFWIGFLNIIIIDLVLSGDNAVVVGMASRRLPPKERKKAILWGTFGAVGLRILFTGLATWLLEIPYIKLVGGCLLIWIALKLLIQHEEASNIQSGKSIWEAVKIIVIADFVMSLENLYRVKSVFIKVFVKLKITGWVPFKIYNNIFFGNMTESETAVLPTHSYAVNCCR